MEVLKPDIIERIKADTILQGELAFEMRVQTVSMYRILRTNNKKLTHPNTLKFLSKKLGVPVTELVVDQVVA